MTRKERIKRQVESFTKLMIQNKQISHNGITAEEISFNLGLDRTNVSRELNKMWMNGELIKIQGRPVLFVDYNLIKIEYPNCYIPTTISRNGSLLDFISNVSIENKTEFKHIHNPLNVIAGAEGSLKNDVQKAIAAASYPPCGIPTLLVGRVGTGKRKFAEYVYYYLVERSIRSDSSRFLIVNCSDYATDDEMFKKIVFGSAKSSSDKASKGLIESTENGFIYFDDIQKLSQKSLSLIRELIIDSSYSRYGENIKRQLNATVFASITINNEDTIPTGIYEYFPIVIKIPDYNRRTAFEKIEIVLSLFSREAFNTKRKIVINKSIVYLLAAYNYKENETQLRNAIKSTCAKAFLNAGVGSDSVAIDYLDLPDEILASKEQNDILARVLAFYKSDSVVCEINGECLALDFFRNIQKEKTYSSMKQFIKEFDVDLSRIPSYYEFICNTVDILLSLDNEHFFELRNNIEPAYLECVLDVLSSQQDYKRIIDDQRIMYGMTLLMQNMSKKIRKNPSPAKTVRKSTHQKESQLVERINSLLEEKKLNTFNSEEKNFLCEFLYLSNVILNNSTVSILVICKGEHIASELCNNCEEYAKEKRVRIEAINYGPYMQFNDLLELCYLAINRLNNGTGVLVLVDSYPLTDIEERLQKECNTKIKVISSVSYNLLTSTIESSGEYKALNDIALTSTSLQNRKEYDLKNNDQLIEMLINNVLSKTVLYVNPKKAADALVFSLHLILDKLGIPYKQSIAVKYISHGIHMIERIIKEEALPYYQLKKFTEKNYELMNTISQSLTTTQNIFDIHIPDSEIAYLAEIFLEVMQ